MGSEVPIHPTGVENLLPGDRDISVANTSLLRGITCLALSGEGPSCSGDMMLEWHIRKRGGETTVCAPTLPFHEIRYWHHGVSLACLLAHQDCPKVSQCSEGGMDVKPFAKWDLCLGNIILCPSFPESGPVCSSTVPFPSEIKCWAYWLQLQMQYLHCWNGFRKAVLAFSS